MASESPSVVTPDQREVAGRLYQTAIDVLGNLDWWLRACSPIEVMACVAVLVRAGMEMERGLRQ